MAPACAPNRKARNSRTLGRPTCLTEVEEKQVEARIPARGGSLRTMSDRELAKHIGAKDVRRPEMPSDWSQDPKTWLSNVDINGVMEQYARVSDEFLYLGTWPTDFAERARSGGRCVKVCTPDPFKEAWDKKKLAASIINLDVHTGSGTHWVAFALDCRGSGPPRMMYYDPTGRPPPKRWLKKSAWAVIAACADEIEDRRDLLETAVHSKKEHQHENTECGIFSMMCIDALVAGRSFESFCASPLSDDEAFKHRRVFFDFPEDAQDDPVATNSRGKWSWAQLLFGGAGWSRQRSRTKS